MNTETAGTLSLFPIDGEQAESQEPTAGHAAPRISHRTVNSPRLHSPQERQ